MGKLNGDKMNENLDLVRRCLTLVSRIAARGASSPDHEHVSDTLFELSFALERHPYSAGTLRPPVSLKGIYFLQKLHEELDYIDSTSQGYTALDFLKFVNTSTW